MRISTFCPRALFPLFLVGSLLSVGVSPAQDAADGAPLLTLDHAIQLAMANNRSLKIASLEVDQSKWQVAGTKTKRLPDTTAYLFGSGLLNSPTFSFRQGLFGEVGGTPVPTRNTNVPLSAGPTAYAVIQVTQPLSQLYKIHLAVRQQELSVDMNNEKFRAQRQSTVANVKDAYYAVLQTESALQAEEASVKQYEELDRVVLQYVSQEVALKSDSLDVKAKLAQEQYKLVQLHDNLQTQKEQLNDLLGRDISISFRTEPVPEISPAETDLRFAQQTALSQRPEIKQAEITVRQAEYDRRLAKSQYIPDVGAALHYLSPFNVDIVPKNIVAAGIELNWEPWDWGRRKDDINQKKVALDQSQYQLQETRSKILIDVNNRFRKLNQSRTLLAVTEAARAAENEKLREVTGKYGQKAVLLRDVLQQQAAVANADNNYQQAVLSFWAAKADFEKSLGED
jgi:outer membrane protein TolC